MVKNYLEKIAEKIRTDKSRRISKKSLSLGKFPLKNSSRTTTPGKKHKKQEKSNSDTEKNESESEETLYQKRREIFYGQELNRKLYNLSSLKKKVEQTFNSARNIITKYGTHNL